VFSDVPGNNPDNPTALNLHTLRTLLGRQDRGRLSRVIDRVRFAPARGCVAIVGFARRTASTAGLLACAFACSGESEPRAAGEDDTNEEDGADSPRDDNLPNEASDDDSPGGEDHDRASDDPSTNEADDLSVDDETPAGGVDDESLTDSGSTGEPAEADDAAESSAPPASVTPSTSVVPRLSQAELNNALRDVLGDPTAPASVYLAEDEFSPYDNDATRQTVSVALVDSMAVLAEDVARRLSQAPARDSWMPCVPTGMRDEACFDQAVTTLTRALFRRPATPESVAPYRVLLDFAEEQGDFYVGVELLLWSLLQDPETLYRIERGTPIDGTQSLQLNDFEIATRLSLLLWGSLPDPSLLDGAEDGALVDAAGRRDAAERLLTDPRSKRQLARFHSMWLGYRAIPHDAALNAAFQMETEALISRVVFDEPQNYLTLFLSPETYLNDQLALHYGLAAPPGGEGWVRYADDNSPNGTRRAGILSHGSVLSGFSKFSDTSPTQRGIFVRTRLMCLDVPPPPATVDVDQPPSTAADGDCKVDRYRAHREQSGCSACHELFEPIGIGLENFDRAGRYRPTDDDNPNCQITEPGNLPGYGQFTGPAELALLLTDNSLIQNCFVRQYLQYSLAKGALSEEESALADTLTAAFEARTLRLDEWLLDFVGDARFAQRTAEDAQ
jgi:hypothetical protein